MSSPSAWTSATSIRGRYSLNIGSAVRLDALPRRTCRKLSYTRRSETYRIPVDNLTVSAISAEDSTGSTIEDGRCPYATYCSDAYLSELDVYAPFDIKQRVG